MTLGKPNYTKHFGFLISKTDTTAIIFQRVDRRIKSDNTPDKVHYNPLGPKQMPLAATVTVDTVAQHVFCLHITLCNVRMAVSWALSNYLFPGSPVSS